MKKALWIFLAVGIALAGAWGYGELVRRENDTGQPLRLLAIAEEQSLSLSFSRRGRLTTRVPEEGEAIANGQEVARIEVHRELARPAQVEALHEARVELFEPRQPLGVEAGQGPTPATRLSRHH